MKCLHLNLVIGDEIKNYGNSLCFEIKCIDCDAWKSIDIIPEWDNKWLTNAKASVITNQ